MCQQFLHFQHCLVVYWKYSGYLSVIYVYANFYPLKIGSDFWGETFDICKIILKTID